MNCIIKTHKSQVNIRENMKIVAGNFFFGAIKKCLNIPILMNFK